MVGLPGYWDDLRGQLGKNAGGKCPQRGGLGWVGMVWYGKRMRGKIGENPWNYKGFMVGMGRDGKAREGMVKWGMVPRGGTTGVL